MTEHTDTKNTSPDNLIQLLLNEGYENGFPRIAGMILNAAMLIERRIHLSARPYERCEKRNGYANRFKERVFKSTLGEMNLKIPQTRESSDPFHPSLLEKRSRIDQTFKSAIAEMYPQGVSTRRVKHAMAELCGMEVSSTQV